MFTGGGYFESGLGGYHDSGLGGYLRADYTPYLDEAPRVKNLHPSQCYGEWTWYLLSQDSTERNPARRPFIRTFRRGLLDAG